MVTAVNTRYRLDTKKAVNRRGTPVDHFSVSSHDDEHQYVQILVTKGSWGNVNERDCYYNAPLHKAISHRCSIDVIHELLHAGAEVNATNAAGITPIFEAVRAGDLAAVEVLTRKGARLDVKDSVSGEWLMDAALSRQHEAIVSFLHEQGMSMNTMDDCEMTALHRAAGRRPGNVWMVGVFVSKGGDINTRDKAGRTALHVAADSGDVAMVSKLIKHGCLIDGCEKGGRTALHIAACLGRVNIINKLVELSADVNIARKGGEAPLFLVVRYSNIHGTCKDEDMAASIEALLCAGADAYASEARGLRPMDFIHELESNGMPQAANQLKMAACLQQ